MCCLTGIFHFIALDNTKYKDDHKFYTLQKYLCDIRFMLYQTSSLIQINCPTHIAHIVVADLDLSLQHLTGFVES